MAPTLTYSTFAFLSSLLLISKVAVADPAISTNVNSAYAYLGCYTDNVNSRSLYQKATTDPAMTEEMCVNFCSSNGYAYAGVEYSQECYCGSYIAASGSKTADTDCNMACAGNNAELCGGPSRLNVFHNTSDVAAASGPAHNAGPPGWGFLGCYTDSVGSRTLPNTGYVNGKMTVAGCTASCQASGYLFSGVEYSGECYCGNTLPNSFLAPDGLTGCNMVCNGNSSEFCGGANRLDAFGYGQRSTIAPKWDTLGCYNDSVQARGLRYQVQVVGGIQNNTIPGCQAACLSNGYTIAGVEYGQECWCDTAFQNNIGPASDGNAQCNMACKGDPSTVCGGPDRLNVYRYNVVSSSTTSTTAAPTTTGTATGTTTTGVVTTTTTTTSASNTATLAPVGNFTYQGCYVDGVNGRILRQGPNSNTLTIESCIAGCSTQGFTIAGMEYSTECYCGNAIFNGGKLAAQDSDCAMQCGGNSSEVCGGPSRVSVYSSNNNITTYAVPTAKQSNLPGNWQYQGCLTDNPQPRVLPYQIDMPNNLTINSCLTLCSNFGFSAASVEYGQQCFCGDDTDRVNAGVQFLTGNQCNTPCPMDPESLCGGANAMNYYTWTGLNTWNQATGDAAGIYQFLIGGPIVPLITSVERNGKILFTEKHGAGQYPVANSTGVYEFDPMQVNNYSAAWRELQGLQTNVFCSAGLMLPDKAGRVINIGGWADDDTWGIRFYTPDGFNDTQGINGWEEDFHEVRLLDGRWYPGAMVMANGSILVVGGESGSNAPAVPTLEVIPTPAGVTQSVYMDWLERTDPSNLYPFLAVLPQSGNIAVFYYNEARILDKNTFQTVTTLPNMPGQVNNFLAGRTYPMEGTAMLLPQSAPYTDPLGVLICGGSTPYQGIALDNCITINPEVPGANWTLERMPSKRVISSMVALPDGTYLIMNGGQQGFAGFGLGQEPNHMALLYDPTKPLNSRFTRMANTTLDRLYHSEAILMMDGRVLVSGSDPEDNPQVAQVVHLQEYRVETFTPPYLMGNRAATRPDFQILTNGTNNLGYGQSFQIAVNSTVGKISFMAAVSSTHGNSFGQRTIFPSFSCGQQATNTASNSSASSVSSSNSTSTVTRRQTSSNSTITTPSSNSTSSSSAAYNNICTITTPPNANVAPPSWHQVFVLDSNGTPSVSQWIRIGGDPAQLGNWPNFPDFTLPGV